MIRMRSTLVAGDMISEKLHPNMPGKTLTDSLEVGAHGPSKYQCQVCLNHPVPCDGDANPDQDPGGDPL